MGLWILCILSSLISSAFAAESVDWNQWRGPQRNGSVPGAGWPTSLADLQPLWEVPLGKGYSGALVTEDAVFVVETVDKSTVAARAIRRADGSELWATSWPGRGKVPFFAAKNGDWVRSTPVWDGETLYVGDMEEKLLALDGKSGEIRWTVDFPERFGTRVPDFGFSSSPLVDGDAIYVQAANSLIKLDRRTGETLWRALGGSGDIMASGSFSSPVIRNLAGVRQLVVLTRHTLFGVALEDGAQLWSRDVPNFRGMNILTPVFDGDRVFTSPYRNGSYLFEITKGDEGFKVAERWKNPASGYMSSPVVIDGFVYMHLGNGRVSCIELATGDERWRSKSFGDYWSMVWQGDKILALDESGELVLMRASPDTFEILDRREITEREAWGHLAIRADQIFVRDLESVRAYRWSDAPAPAPAGAR